MNLIKKLVQFSLYFIYLFIVVFLLLEIVFRVLPTSDSLKLSLVNENSPIIHYKPNRTINRQIGFNFKHVSKKHINNYGFFTDQDFFPQSKPIVIIGDSFVEAVQVKNEDTFHGLISKNNKDLKIYPIAISGAPISQYLAFANFALENFNPDIYVFLLIYNDFDESFKTRNSLPGFHYFNEIGDLERTNYKPPLFKKILSESAFIRYIHIDLQFTTQIKKLIKNPFYFKEIKEIRTNWDLQNGSTKELENQGFKAANFFLEKIEKISREKKVVILIDGDRNSIYADKLDRDLNKVFNKWFEIIIKEVKTMQNIELINLQNHFSEDWKKNRKKFNYSYDFHWNEHGHKIVYQALDPVLKGLK